MTNDKPELFGEKTIEAWDRKWVKVPGGLMQPHLPANQTFSAR
jgi:hypothetical protein